MQDRIEKFLETVASSAMDLGELKELYQAIGNIPLKCESASCVNKMLNEVKKYHYLNFVKPTAPQEPRKYTLKEGNHAIAPGGPADHNNDNTNDADIEFYLIHFPHVKDLLINGN